MIYVGVHSMSSLASYARPYARAAFEFAVEENKLKDWELMLSILRQIILSDKVRKRIDNPIEDSSKKIALVLELASDFFDSSFKNFVKLLASRSRLILIGEIFDIFVAHRLRKEGVMRVEIFSAELMAESSLSALVLKLEKRFGARVDAIVNVDAGLIGGFTVRSGDIVIDASLRGRLRKLAEILN